MRTDQRLTSAYEGARVELLDETSRYVFMSDCHRGDTSPSDEFTRNQNIYIHALRHYFGAGYVYVEVGDGDELWEQPAFKHIRTAHYDAFEVIRRFHSEDRLIMIYGNHNIFLRDPKYVVANYFTYYDEYRETTHDFMKGLEPCEALVLKNDATGQEIFTVHGHQGDFANDQAWYFTMLALKYFWRYMHAFGFKNPASPVKNANKRHKIEKNYVKWIAKHRTMLICGHTHRFKYPRPTELPYFNTGSCLYPTSVIALEIANGLVQLVRWRITVEEAGVLQVARQTIRGPDPLEKFDIR